MLDLAGPDRITESRTGYEQDASRDWWQVLSQQVSLNPEP